MTETHFSRLASAHLSTHTVQLLILNATTQGPDTDSVSSSTPAPTKMHDENQYTRCQASKKVKHLEQLSQALGGLPFAEATPPEDHHVVNSERGQNELILSSAPSFCKTAIWGHVMQWQASSNHYVSTGRAL